MAVGTVALTVAGGLGMATILTTVYFGQEIGPTALGNSQYCAATVDAPSGVTHLDSDQLNNARIIVQVGVDLGVPPRGWVIALATALQESTLRNLHYGDRDSVGLFQQRPGWGSVSELTTPSIAARKFYEKLITVRDWQLAPLAFAAQSVQQSQFPRAYAKWENLASTLVSQMTGRTDTKGAPTQVAAIACGEVAGASLPGGTVGEVIQIALHQRGKLYLWGGIGPDFFDCSGLVSYAWRKTGHPLTVRTSEQMFVVSDRISAGSEQPGDLLFGDFHGGLPGHVMIVVTPGVAIEAPHTGDVVKLISYDATAWTIGRFNASAFVSGTVPG